MKHSGPGWWSPTGPWAPCCRRRIPTLDDFQGHEGCNEILNISRPDIVQAVHEEYFRAGVDCVETNTFGANHTNLGDYDISDRVFELSEAGARLAREVADGFATADKPRWVIGSIGPGTKLPSLGQIGYATCATPTRPRPPG